MFGKLFVSIEMLCRGLQSGAVTQEDLDRGIFFLPEQGPAPALERLQRFLPPGQERGRICERIASALRQARRDGRLARLMPFDDDPGRVWADLNRLLAKNGLPEFPDPESAPSEEEDEDGMIGFFGRFRGAAPSLRNEVVTPPPAWTSPSWAE